ncbi:MAG: helix-turn-helix transcriptional regulator [Crenarchaeota archaeon]|nr:helix-turn-helix transcriptional regulator [Thermoproteota archaeon]
MNYSQKIYDLRKKEDISQEALAALIGTTRQQVSRWECGAAIPNPKFAYAIASHFGITVEELFGEKVEEEPGDAKEVLSFRFKNISLCFSIVSLINFCAMVLLGYFSDSISKSLHEAVGAFRESGVEYDPGTYNSAIRNLSESICSIGIVWVVVSSILLLFVAFVLLIRFSKTTKNKILRSNLFSSFSTSLLIILGTLVASVLTLSIGQHVGYININTFGFFEGLLFLFGALFTADFLVTFFRMILRKPLQKSLVLAPWEGFRKVYEIIYVAIGLPLFIAFVVLGSISFVGSYYCGFFYFPLALILLLIHTFACYKPFGKRGS